MSRLARLAPTLPLIPFLLYLTVFLLIPTVTVVVGAFTDSGRFTLDNLTVLASGAALRALWRSIVLAGSTALIGGFAGALLAYLVVTRPPTSLLRRVVTSISGVLAQVGGVTLAFAYISMLGFSGVLTLALA